MSNRSKNDIVQELTIIFKTHPNYVIDCVRSLPNREILAFEKQIQNDIFIKSKTRLAYIDLIVRIIRVTPGLVKFFSKDALEIMHNAACFQSTGLQFVVYNDNIKIMEKK
jgi:hypothetical protein